MGHSAGQLLFKRIGSPHVDEAFDHEVEPCWMCGGESERGVKVDDFNGASFTGQNRVAYPPGKYTCEACLYLCSRISPVPGRPPKDGKKFGGNFRNYSHLMDVERYINASKGEKPGILAFLRGPKKGDWFGAIADSGQKHVLPWAPLNPEGSRGRVLFDETMVQLPDESGWKLVDDLVALLTAGATKESIASGDYNVGEWQRCEADIRAFEAKWAKTRASSWFVLAVWLAQRDEAGVAERLATEKAAKAEKQKAKSERAKKPSKKPVSDSNSQDSKGAQHGKARRKGGGHTANVDGGSPAGGAQGVSGKPRGKCAQELGHAAITHEDRVQDGGDSRAVGNDPAAGAERNCGTVGNQLSLFG